MSAILEEGTGNYTRRKKRAGLKMVQLEGSPTQQAGDEKVDLEEPDGGAVRVEWDKTTQGKARLEKTQNRSGHRMTCDGQSRRKVPLGIEAPEGVKKSALKKKSSIPNSHESWDEKELSGRDKKNTLL